MIKTLMEESKYFKVDDKYFEYDEVDEIYFLTTAVPSKNTNGSNKCYTCELEFKSTKQVSYW